MEKKVLYLGEPEERDMVVELTNNQNAYIIEASSIGAAKILLSRLNIEEILIKYEQYSWNTVEFLEFLKNSPVHKLTPIIFYKKNLLDIEIVDAPKL